MVPMQSVLAFAGVAVILVAIPGPSAPRRLAAIGGVGGLVMIGLGVSVAATGRKD